MHQALGALLCLVARAGRGHQERELVAANARYHFAGLAAAFKAPRNLPHQCVTGGVAEGVVDAHEPVEVHVKHRASGFEAGTRDFQEALLVGEAGEPVVVLEARAPLFGFAHPPGGTNVPQRALHDRHEPPEVAFVDMVVCPDPHCRVAAIVLEGARIDDERDVLAGGLEDLQGAKSVKMRHRMVGNHQVPRLVQRLRHVGCTVDTVDLEAGHHRSEHRFKQQGVVFRILHQQDACRFFCSHGRMSLMPCTGMFTSTLSAGRR